MRSIIFALALVLGSTVSAQQASYTYINQPSSYNPTWLTALNTPKIGGAFQVQVPASTPGGFAGLREVYFLMTGFSRLNLDLGPLLPQPYFSPGFLFTSAEIVMLSPTQPFPSPPVVVPLAIPMDPSLIGANFYQQVLKSHCVERVCPVGLLSLSRGGHAVIGM